MRYSRYAAPAKLPACQRSRRRVTDTSAGLSPERVSRCDTPEGSHTGSISSFGEWRHDKSGGISLLPCGSHLYYTSHAAPHRQTGVKLNKRSAYQTSPRAFPPGVLTAHPTDPKAGFCYALGGAALRRGAPLLGGLARTSSRHARRAGLGDPPLCALYNGHCARFPSRGSPRGYPIGH